MFDIPVGAIIVIESINYMAYNGYIGALTIMNTKLAPSTSLQVSYFK